MRITIIAALGATLLTACGQSAPPAAQGPSDYQYINVGQEKVRERLRDPSSAVFTEVRVSRSAGIPAVCGYVNSRNGFGGMSGPKRFIAGAVVGLEDDFAPGEFERSWAQLCG